MRLLASRLSNDGLKVKVTSLKTDHFPASIVVILLAKILVRKRKDVYPIRALIDDRLALFKRLFKLWLILGIWGIFVRFLLSIYLPMKMGYLVIVEEYIPATIADYMYLRRVVRISCNTVSFATDLMLRLKHVSDPMLVIFLDAHIDLLKSRWSHRKSLDEEPDYIHMQCSTLLSLSKKLSSCRLLYINTTKQTIEETHKLITKYLMKP